LIHFEKRCCLVHIVFGFDGIFNYESEFVHLMEIFRVTIHINDDTVEFTSSPPSDESRFFTKNFRNVKVASQENPKKTKNCHM
jgi:hypothetical protein